MYGHFRWDWKVVLLEQEQVWRLWVSNKERIVSFHAEEGYQLLEFCTRELFLKCVDQYMELQYRYQ